MAKFFTFLGVILVSTAFGQTFRNVRILKEEEKISIIYDLIYDEPGSKVIVTVFGSHNNFETPILNLSGDIDEVLPGPNRRIEWSVKDLPKNYSDDITFRFKGEIIHGWKFLNPANGTLRRGKGYTLKWMGGNPSDTITLKFISPEQITNITTTKNTGFYKWRVPKKLKTGSGYVIRLSKGKEVYEQQIIMKRKIPLVLIAVPVAGLAIFLGISDSGSSGPGDLPNAPKPN